MQKNQMQKIPMLRHTHLHMPKTMGTLWQKNASLIYRKSDVQTEGIEGRGYCCKMVIKRFVRVVVAHDISSDSDSLGGEYSGTL